MPARPRDITEYDRKRDFEATPEPSGAATAPAEGPLRFMVHEHHATRLHYDLRLEAGGVLKSWAVPKGPSSDPTERRLAVQTEDHPLPYGGFEGVIPKGSYGAGETLIWDAGTYSPDEKGDYAFHDREAASRRILDEIDAGKVSFTLRGKKLKGSWSLVRTKDAWLLLKHRDFAADPTVELTEDGASVATGLTVTDLRQGRRPPANYLPWDYTPALLKGSRAGPPELVEPMLATLAPIPTSGKWWFEPKLDGIRALALIQGGTVQMRSRRGQVIQARYPGIVADLARQPAASLVVDGEIVAIDANGRPSFELLQQRMNLSGREDIADAERRIPTVYFVFDILHLDGYDLAKVPLEERREVLARVLAPISQVARVITIDAEADAAYEAAISAGFEGIIAKRAGSTYEVGRRSPAWLKRKGLDRDTFVVGGFTRGLGSRERSFGGLLIGARQADGTLAYRGRVGGGFTEATLADVLARLEPLAVKANPFEGTVPDVRKATFVTPELEVLVEYKEVTAGGQLRAPIFKGLARGPVVSMPGTSSARAPQPLERQDECEAVKEQLASPKQRLTLEARDWSLGVTNLDKVLWPEYGSRRALTKRDLLTYAASIYAHIQPHLRDRPLTLTRFPNGINAPKFYQKHWEEVRPPFVETFTMFSDTEQRDRDFLLCNNLPTLLWLCQLADIEFHAALSRVVSAPDAPSLSTTFTGSVEALDHSVLNYPDFILFDLDPYIYAGHEKKGDEPQPNQRAFDAACDIARALKEVLDSLGMNSFVKSSGATGVHIYVPIVRNLTYPEVRAAANTVCVELLSRRPKEVTMEWATNKRNGTVFLDANQNGRHKSLASIYSPRAKPGGPVSLPETWDTLGLDYPWDHSILDVPELVAERGEPWAGILDAKQDLGALLKP